MDDRAIICGRCGAENEAEATFCAQCGALLSAYEAPTADGLADTPESTEPGAAENVPRAPESAQSLSDWESLFPRTPNPTAFGPSQQVAGVPGNDAGVAQPPGSRGRPTPEERTEWRAPPPPSARRGTSAPPLPPARAHHPPRGEWTAAPSLESNARAVIIVGIALVLLSCLWFIVALVTRLSLWVSLACLLPLGVVLLAVGIVMLLVAPKRRGDGERG